MALIKKTAVLTNKGALGYITVVRLGDEVGAKIVGDTFTSDMLSAIKLGTGKIFYAKITGKRTEIALNVDFNQDDEINCTICDEEEVVAKCGKVINVELINTTFYPNGKSQKKTPILDNAFAPNPISTQKPGNIKKEQDSSKAKNSQKPKQDTPKETPRTVEYVAQNVEQSNKNSLEDDFLSRLNSKGEKNFYANIKEKIDELFVIHPTEKTLSEVIPDSKWIKIYYDTDDYYVVGVLHDKGVVAYLGYGVPGISKIPPPALAQNICDFLAVPSLPSPYEGYYLIFQNAQDGKVENI